CLFFFSSRRRHTRFSRDWSSDVCSSDLSGGAGLALISLGSPATFLIGAVLAFSAGWGWTGLLLASAIHLLPGRAENAGHLVQVRSEERRVGKECRSRWCA